MNINEIFGHKTEVKPEDRKKSTKQLQAWLTRQTGEDASHLDRERTLQLVAQYKRGLITLAEVEFAIVETREAKPDTPFNHIYEAAQTLEPEYHTVSWPITTDGTLFWFDGGPKFRMTERGLGYITYRLGEHLDAYVTVTMPANETVDLLNEARSRQVASTDKAGRRTNFVLVTQSPAGECEIASLLTTYKQVPNTEVLDAIEEAGLHGHVTHAYLSKTEMKVYVTSSFATAGGFDSSWGVRVTNGTTGHRALNYSSFFLIDDFEYSFKSSNWSRHLGQVDAVADDLKALWNESAAAEVILALEKMDDASAAALAISAVEAKGYSPDKVSEFFIEVMAEIPTSGNGKDVVAALTIVRAKKGRKTIAAHALNGLFSAVEAKTLS